VWMTVASALIGTTGGLRPPLLCCGANVYRRKTVFSTHKRTPKKERRASARRGFANRLCNGNARDFRKQVRMPRTHHGGLTPPALALRCECLPAKNDFFDAQTHAEKKSGGRQPAVGSQTASATAMRRISVIRFAFREPTTGGLRPPLLRTVYRRPLASAGGHHPRLVSFLTGG
jgi:hypothetical protein